MEKSSEEFRPVIVNNKFALFTSKRIDDTNVPAGVYKYELASEHDVSTIEKNPVENCTGTILTFYPFDFKGKTNITLNDDTSLKYIKSMCDSILFKISADTVILIAPESNHRLESVVFMTTKKFVTKINERAANNFDHFIKTYTEDEATEIYESLDDKSFGEFNAATAVISPVFYVTYKIDGRFIAEVRACNKTAARELSEDCYTDADFGALEDIEGKPIVVEDENGNFVWENM